MTVKIDGTNGIDTAQLRPADGDPVAITIAADGKVAFPQNAQTWQNVSGSRTPGVTYTNNTSLPITVHFIASDTVGASGADINITVGGLIVARERNVGNSGLGGASTCSAVVPAGETYVLGYTNYGGSPTLSVFELRN